MVITAPAAAILSILFILSRFSAADTDQAGPAVSLGDAQALLKATSDLMQHREVGPLRNR